MFVRFFLALAVALHRIAVTLRIVATKADTAASQRRCDDAYHRQGVAWKGVSAAESFAQQCNHAATAAGAEYQQTCRKNNGVVDRLRAAAL